MRTEREDECLEDLYSEIIPKGLKAFLIEARKNGFASGKPAEKDPETGAYRFVHRNLESGLSYVDEFTISDDGKTFSGEERLSDEFIDNADVLVYKYEGSYVGNQEVVSQEEIERRLTSLLKDFSDLFRLGKVFGYRKKEGENIWVLKTAPNLDVPVVENGWSDFEAISFNGMPIYELTGAGTLL